VGTIAKSRAVLLLTKRCSKKIPYFERSPAGHFVEARQLALPEDKPDAFAQVMELARRGKCSMPIYSRRNARMPASDALGDLRERRR
jgi:hypothetical protein